jgi:hypothetical protein
MTSAATLEAPKSECFDWSMVKVSGMPCGVGGVGVVPARGQLDAAMRIRGVAVDLVRAHVHKRRLRAGLAGGLEEIQRADRVGVEVVERDGGGAVVRGLGGGVDDDGRA